MKTTKLNIPILFLLIFSVSMIIFGSCKKKDELFQDPEIEPIKHGFQVSAAVGYCASLANSLFKGEDLPNNVLFEANNNPNYSGSGIMYVDINQTFPLPFNSNVGQIVIACLWDVNYNQTEYSGVMTTVFTDINILESKYKFVGIRTVPVINTDAGDVLTLFAEQDIVIGEGSDTLLNLSLTNPQFNAELARLDATQPSSTFAAVKQNVWFISIDQNNSSATVYDDEFKVNGGGQIAGVTSESGGILYHSMIGAKFIYQNCNLNPTSGVGFIQNLKVGDETDLGTILLNFHETCDGKAFVVAGTGKYITSNRQNVNLNFY